MSSKDILAANPQGKASIALLSDLESFKSYKIRAKDAPEWLADYFTSLLVLSASFNFKPVINKPYYLYLDNDQWKLSLIEPNAWPKCSYLYFAKCYMHEDKTWSVQPDENWQENTILIEKINSIKEQFLQNLNDESPAIEALPYFAEQLPYYRRLAAFGMAHSLRNSLQLKLGLQSTQNISGSALLKKAKQTNFLSLTSQSQDF